MRSDSELTDFHSVFPSEPPERTEIRSRQAGLQRSAVAAGYRDGPPAARHKKFGREAANFRVQTLRLGQEQSLIGGDGRPALQEVIKSGALCTRRMMRYIRSFNRKAIPIKCSYKDASNRIKSALESSDTAHYMRLRAADGNNFRHTSS